MKGDTVRHTGRRRHARGKAKSCTHVGMSSHEKAPLALQPPLPISHCCGQGVSPELSLCLYKHSYCVYTVEKKWNHIYISFCKPHLSLTGGGASVNITAQVYGILFNRCLIFHGWDSV